MATCSQELELAIELPDSQLSSQNVENEDLKLIMYTNSQLSSQNVEIDGDLNLIMYSNSQLSGSQAALERAGGLIKYGTLKISSQEAFGNEAKNLSCSQKSSNSSLEPTTQNSTTSPTQDPSVSTNSDVFMGRQFAYNSEQLNKASAHSIPESQKTNYFNIPSSIDQQKLSNLLTPESSQSSFDNNAPTIVNEQQEDEMDETYEFEQKGQQQQQQQYDYHGKSALMTPDISNKSISFQTDHNQLDQTVINKKGMINKIAIVNQNTKLAPPNMLLGKDKYGKCFGASSGGKNIEYSTKIDNQMMHTSIGKTEKTLELLGASADHSNYQNLYPSGKGTFGKHIDNRAQINDSYNNNSYCYADKNISYGKSTQLMYQTQNDDQPSMTNQYNNQMQAAPPYNYGSYGKQQHYQTNNQMNYDNNYVDKNVSYGKLMCKQTDDTSNNTYVNQNIQINPHNNNSCFDQNQNLVHQFYTDSAYGSAANHNNNQLVTPLSKADNYHLTNLDHYMDESTCESQFSTTASYVPSDELTGEDSNDSTIRKRRKKKKSESTKAKVRRSSKSNDVKKNAEIQCEEVTSLSQQLEESSLKDKQQQSETTHQNPDDSTFEYYENISDYYSKKSDNYNNSKSQTQKNRKSSSASTKCSKLNRSRSSSINNDSIIDQFEMNIETPKKSSTNLGPISKSSVKKSSQSRKKSTTKNDQFIRKPPVPRKLNIIEVAPTRKLSSSPTPSTLSIDPKQKRKDQNRKSAADYRQRVKEKREQIELQVNDLKVRYNALARKLRDITLQKKGIVDGLRRNPLEYPLPDWMIK